MYDREQPDVWSLFVYFTFQIINRGFDNYSAKSIMERIRWETDKPDYDKGWKINNDFTSFYARKFMAVYPKHKGFFRVREQVSKSKPAVRMEPLNPDDFPYGSP